LPETENNKHKRNILYFRNKKQREIVSEHMRLVSKSLVGGRKVVGKMSRPCQMANSIESGFGFDFKPCPALCSS